VNRKNEAGSECRSIQDDHDQREKIHSNGNPDRDMHSANADQPDVPCPSPPNKKWISGFQNTNENSGNRKQVLQPNEQFRSNYVGGRPNQCAPEIRSIPPTASQTFRQATEKINKTQMNLQHASKKAEQWSIFQRPVSPLLIE
jgi:hypothetical protein